jgi:hypothetical protein
MTFRPEGHARPQAATAKDPVCDMDVVPGEGISDASHPAPRARGDLHFVQSHTSRRGAPRLPSYLTSCG